MNINEASKQIGISKDMIRFYEKKGLIFPVRLSNNYRDYSTHDLHMMILIKQYNSLGIPLSTIKEMLYTNKTAEVANQLTQQIDTLKEEAEWAYARYKNALDLQIVLNYYNTNQNWDTGIREDMYYLENHNTSTQISSYKYVNSGIARAVYHISKDHIQDISYPEDIGLLFSKAHPKDKQTYTKIPSHRFYRTIAETPSNTLLTIPQLNTILSKMHERGYQEQNDIFIYQILSSHDDINKDIICVEITIV